MEGVVPIAGIEADFDVVFSPAVATKDFVYPVAKVTFYFKNQAANPLFGVARAVSQNLLRERIHTAARFPGPDCAEDCDASEQAPLGDDEPLRVFGWQLLAGIVNFAYDEEKIVSFPRIGIEG